LPEGLRIVLPATGIRAVFVFVVVLALT